MSTRERENSGDHISSTARDVGGSLGVGKHITIEHSGGGVRTEMTAADREALQGLFAQLRSQVETEAPADKKAAALERVGELEKAITAKKVDEKTLTTMEYVRNWFVDNLPKLAGAVTGLVVNPIVGTVVAAVGEGLAGQYRQRFGVTDEQT